MLAGDQHHTDIADAHPETERFSHSDSLQVFFLPEVMLFDCALILAQFGALITSACRPVSGNASSKTGTSALQCGDRGCEEKD